MELLSHRRSPAFSFRSGESQVLTLVAYDHSASKMTDQLGDTNLFSRIGRVIGS